MQLYIFPPSPNSLCCQAAANQAGIDLELVPVDLSAGEQMKPEFVKLNPNHKIPTLVDGDFSVWESGAIMIYLAEQAPASRLLPDEGQARIQVLQWLFWKTAHFAPACGVFTFENLVKPMLGLGEPDAAELEKGSENFHRFFGVLNEHLHGRDFVVGKSVTLADHALAAWLVHAEPAKFPLQKYAEVIRWSQAILGSPAWVKALATIPRN